MMGHFLEVLKFNGLFSNSTGASVTSAWFSPFIVAEFGPKTKLPQPYSFT